MGRVWAIVLLSVVTAIGHTLAEDNRGAEIVRELNLAREHPAAYASYLKQLRGRFCSHMLLLPDGKALQTHEGVKAVDEAIRFLQRARPLPLLIYSVGISRAAAEHVADQARGGFGHTGSDHSNPGERMNRHGRWRGGWGENVAYGQTKARDIVSALIIDDGLRGRKHRKNIFNPTFHYAGAALGSHARYRAACSIDFAGGYVEEASPSRQLFAGE